MVAAPYSFTEFHMPNQVHFRKAVLRDVPKIKKLVYDCFIEQAPAYYKMYIVLNLIPQVIIAIYSSELFRDHPALVAKAKVLFQGLLVYLSAYSTF